MLLKRVYWLVAIAFILSGCFKKPDQEGMAVQTALSVVPYSAGATSSYLIAQGPCKGNTAVIITYTSAATPETTQEVKCNFDYVNVHLPIQNGTTNQVFTVNIYGRFQNKKSGAYVTSVNFNPAPPPTEGHTMSIAGGAASGPFASTWDIVGEVFGVTQSQTGPSAIHRSGLSGVIDP